ncbi:MAG: elongation factor P maturation arginine rhamnosyltransferase EarP [Gammaproteobacteria bacterium]|nr:MAG: elongation factor P maturation arginine rhamnosyltransferase EarP [Gammaproteobacteria bacterium]
MNIEIKTWDIFCRVIDNYGDIGVCWRLARQLAREYPFEVRLWVDELDALKQIWPTAQLCGQQYAEKVDVRLWQDDFPSEITSADVVIEAFACNLPESYLIAMKRRVSQPRWFNLEYLSAEDWVEGCHGLTSVHPQLGLKKTFLFPGVTTKTAGLLKEKELLNTSDEFQSNEQTKRVFLQQFGVQVAPDALLISLFGYENHAVASLLEAWMNSPKPIACLVPSGKILPDVSKALSRSLVIGDDVVHGSLQIHVIPFLNQDNYDRLLWACDINFVRGEDSFVRAQWAAKPFVWHIYPQDEDFHMVKLDAFLHRYLNTLDTDTQDSIAELWHQWNRGEDCAEAWNSCLANLQNWQKHGQDWRHHLNSLGDLASNMVHFCQKTL